MTKPPNATRRFEALDRRGLQAITIGALFVGVVNLIVLVFRSIHTLTANVLSVAGLPLANAQAPEFADAAVAISDARYESVALMIEGLPPGLRWLMVSDFTLSALLGIGLSVIVIILGTHLLKKHPFARAATWSTFAAAVLVMVTGMLSPLLHAIADAEIVKFLGEAILANSDTGFDQEGLIIFGVIVDLSPLAWGLALGVVAAAFEFGQRLQRETDGLV
ncbi:hypothetical protein FB472_1937 [Rhodoglobus vestalii]|uniref:DUF2975 domain-containing protein n=1 Tax=Rhodoglobus vestalii TaxID=193384 RepID=A0A8H2K7I4_9MICO|nr:hypothetical protein [Rhodoglobus vestalii]TQO20307.1 hypothetical protein FB472_1937 [Rhodoglobus vestalii]